MKNNRIIIFDTTLRDGEQCPGATMTFEEKIEVAALLDSMGVDVIEAGFPIASDGDFEAVREIARQLARLRVDVIEAGFPVISDGDFAAVRAIAREIKGPVICGLARCVPRDIDAAGQAIKPAGRRGRIHVFLATSKIHREFKLNKARDEILRLAVEAALLAQGLRLGVRPRGLRSRHV